MANLTGFRGDTFNLRFSLTTGTPATTVNLTGATVFFTLKERVSDSDAQATVRKNTPAVSGITTGEAGAITVNIPTGESYFFKTGPYHYGIQVKSPINTVQTSVTGIFNIEADVTRRVVPIS